MVAVIGTVDDDVGVKGGTLSDLQRFYLQWGRGPRPETWSDYGIEQKYGCPEENPSCPIVNDTLALWRHLEKRVICRCA